MNNWYCHKFTIERPDTTTTRWWVDLFLFDTIVRESITGNAANLKIWRIHRRSANDEYGHQFSFYYYSSHKAYEEITSFVSGHKAINILKDANLLHKLSQGSEIQVPCDPSWPLSLQKAWPYYIMGVSQMLLELSESLRPYPRLDLEKVSINDCDIYYTEVMTKLSDIWQNWGSHAFFHHINAIFGYVPLIALPRQVSGMWASF